jgi:hypothetical protein
VGGNTQKIGLTHKIGGCVRKGTMWTRNDIPDYCNDLNAIHEAVTTLPENKWVLYGVRLAWECGHTDKKSVGLWHISTATAYHRAVALSRTLGKWEE